ncbi:MAG TPA: mechanosensitive ion channel domain-containing protein [Dongiaceae bacterium]|nr:mechanosensitive ion channel domain-containing protein [Dongiaceae bacterium]
MDSLRLPAFNFDRLGTLFVVYGLDVLGAIVIAIAGWWVAGVAERMSRRALLSSSHMDLTVAGFLSSLVRYAVLAVVLVLILQVVGIQATSLVAVLGATSLAIGLALQGTLANMAAGVMLLIFRPFRIGDSIEVAGKSGTVRSLNLFLTELASGDNVQVLIPNGQVWGQALTNTSRYDTRRVTLRLPVAFEKDVPAVAARLREFLEKDPRVQKAPPPSVGTAALTDAGVELSVEAWAAAGEAGAVRTDLLHFAMTVLHAPLPAKASAAA